MRNRKVFMIFNHVFRLCNRVSLQKLPATRAEDFCSQGLESRTSRHALLCSLLNSRAKAHKTHQLLQFFSRPTAQGSSHRYKNKKTIKSQYTRSQQLELLTLLQDKMATNTDHHADAQPRKAIIPIAGLGTRMFPLSGIVPKAFMPILEAPPADSESGSSSALVRPFLHSLLRYVLDPATGIQQVCVVISEDQVTAILITVAQWFPY
jgi:hypothetical protein